MNTPLESFPGRRVGVVFGGVAESAEELGDHEAKYAHVVGLHVLIRDADPGLLKELLNRASHGQVLISILNLKLRSRIIHLLEFIHLVRGGADVEEDDLGIAVDEPAAAVDLVSALPEILDSLT